MYKRQSIRGTYIHHNPTIDQIEKDELKDFYYNNTLELYKNYFGEYDKIFWSVNGQVCKECCDNCDSE